MRGRKSAPEAALSRRIVGYVRVSTEDQADSGVSLDAQRARIEAYAAAQALELAEIIVDAGESAKSLQRPGMARILDGIRAGEISAVVALKLDRITRSIRDLNELLDLFSRHDAALVSVTESIDSGSAAGRMIVNLLGVLAQFEREQIGERTAFALGYKRRERKAYSPTPYGYRREDDTLIPDSLQQEVLVHIRSMHKSGASYRQIVTSLESKNVKPPRGQRWYAASVRSILQSRIALEAKGDTLA